MASQYAFAHITTTLSQLKLSPYQTVFHTHTHPSSINFSSHITRDSSKTCIATYCNSLPPHYSDKDVNPFFHSLLKKPNYLWLSTAEHAMLEVYSTVHRQITNKLNSQSPTFETTPLQQLPHNTFVIHTNFTPIKFSNKLKPL